MTYELTFAGKDLSEFGLTWDNVKLFDKPEAIYTRYEIPYRNGDLMKSNDSFKNVQIAYRCFIDRNFRQNYSELVNYLNSFDTYQRLENSLESDTYRMAVFHSAIEPVIGDFALKGWVTLVFDCMPQEWLKSGENEMPIDMQTTTYTDPVEVDIEYDDALVDNAVLTLSPVQDLNGQEYPWVDRVGRNKLNLVNMAKTETVNGITFTLTDEGKIYMNGTQDGSTTVTMWFPFASIETIPNGIWKINGLPSNMTFGDYGFSVFKNNDSSPTELYENNSEVTGTITNFGVWVYEGVTVNNVELKPMIRESTDTSDVWQPYERTSNICPIYPANGKNLLPTNLKYQKASTQVGIGTTGSYIHVDRGQYTLSVYFTEAVTGWSLYYLLEGGSATRIDNSGTFSLDTSGNYLFYVHKSGGLSVDLVDKWQLEQGDRATSYVPYQSVNIIRTGENIFDQSKVVRGSISDTGVDIGSFIRLRTPFIKVKPSTKYAFQCNSEVQLFEIHEYDENNEWQRYTTVNETSYIYTSGANAHYIKFLIRYADNSTILPSALTAGMVEEGDTESDFEPYQSNTYTTDLERFVYGGTVDLATGVLTVTMDIVDLGTLEYEYNGTRFKALGGQIPITNKPTRLKGICENYATFNGSVASAPNGTIIFSDSSTEFYIKDSNYTSVESFKTAMNGVMMCYDLASPQTYYLSAQDVSLLQGKNYFTAEQPVSVTITEGTTLTNPSYMKARPIIKLNNTGTGTVKLNGDVVVRVTEAPSNVPIYIDCENMNCYSYDEDGNVLNENGNVTLPEGYIEMEKGNNRFTATGQLEPTMIPRWWRL